MGDIAAIRSSLLFPLLPFPPSALFPPLVLSLFPPSASTTRMALTRVEEREGRIEAGGLPVKEEKRNKKGQDKNQDNVSG